MTLPKIKNHGICKVDYEKYEDTMATAIEMCHIVADKLFCTSMTLR